MAFFVSHSTDFEEAQPSRYFGLFNANGSASTRVLAVELDIAKAEDVLDINDNHVGIDVNSPVSVQSANASYYSDNEVQKIDMKLVSGDPIQVWVDYEGTVINVAIAPLKVQKTSRSLLSQHINLTEVFRNSSRLFDGFSAATGAAVSDQYIVGWSFSTDRGSLQRLDISRLVEVPHSSAPHKKLPIILLVCLSFVVLSLLA